MWTLAIPSLLLCFSAVFTTDDPCDTCTSTYNRTDDTNCSSLKSYLNCLETASGKTELCVLTDGNASKIKIANCTGALPQACNCQKDLWGTKGTSKDNCTALATYNACLNATGTLQNSTCQAGLNVSTLITNADTRLAACKKNACSPRPCKNGGKCNVTEGGNVTVGGSNYTCDCTSGYSGQDCDEGPCKGHSCTGHGKCKADETDQTKATCICDHGYQGDQCQNAGVSKEMSLVSFLATLLAANIIRMILS